MLKTAWILGLQDMMSFSDAFLSKNSVLYLIALRSIAQTFMQPLRSHLIFN